MPQYPRIPDPPDPTGDALADGAALTQYALQTGCTAVLADDQLEAVLHTTVTTIAAGDLSSVARDRLTKVRRDCAAMLVARRKPQPAAVPEPGAHAGRYGPKIPVADLQPAPVLAPAGAVRDPLAVLESLIDRDPLPTARRSRGDDTIRF